MQGEQGRAPNCLTHRPVTDDEITGYDVDLCCAIVSEEDDHLRMVCPWNKYELYLFDYGMKIRLPYISAM